MTPPVSTPAAEATRADLRKDLPAYLRRLSTSMTKFATRERLMEAADVIATLTADKAAAEARERAALTQAATERARVDGLVEALRPFAEAADNLDGSELDRQHLWESPEAMMLTVGDLRQARLAFAESDSHHPHGGDDADRT